MYNIDMKGYRRHFRIEQAAAWNDDLNIVGTALKELMEGRSHCAKAILEADNEKSLERLNYLFDEYDRLIKLILGLD